MGFTCPEIDSTLKKYAQINYDRYIEQGLSHEGAINKLRKVLYKKIKSIQYKIECVNNANGQTAFVTWTFGADTHFLAKLVAEVILEVREHNMAIFPKLIHLFNSEISGEGKPNHDLYLKSIRTSMTSMYPDFCSSDKGYLKEVYDRCGTIISAMGQSAHLKPCELFA